MNAPIGPLEMNPSGGIPLLTPEQVQLARRLYEKGLSLRGVREHFIEHEETVVSIATLARAISGRSPYDTPYFNGA
jgi:hypothetical protein